MTRCYVFGNPVDNSLKLSNSPTWVSGTERTCTAIIHHCNGRNEDRPDRKKMCPEEGPQRVLIKRELLTGRPFRYITRI